MLYSTSTFIFNLAPQTNSMSKSNIIVVSIVVLIALGIIAYAGYQSYTGEGTPKTPPVVDQEKEENPNEGKLITAKHQYNAETGEHIVAGTLITPTICDRLLKKVSVNRSVTPVVATIAFDVVSTAEVCAQALGEARFKVVFEAPESAVIEATLNGTPVALNLIPVASGEDLSDFEIYIKG